MAWSELDAEQGTWTIPSERAKNGRAHTLPLPPMAWQIIEEVPHRAGIDHLFGRGVNGASLASTSPRRHSIVGCRCRPGCCMICGARQRRARPRSGWPAAHRRGCAEPCQRLPRWRRRDLQSRALPGRDANSAGDVGRVMSGRWSRAASGRSFPSGSCTRGQGPLYAGVSQNGEIGRALCNRPGKVLK